MKLLFTGDINFRGDSLTFRESAEILSEVKPYLDNEETDIAKA